MQFDVKGISKFIIGILNQYIKPEDANFSRFTNIKMKLKLMNSGETDVLTTTEISDILQLLSDKLDKLRDAIATDEKDELLYTSQKNENKMVLKKYKLARTFLMNLRGAA